MSQRRGVNIIAEGIRRPHRNLLCIETLHLGNLLRGLLVEERPHRGSAATVVEEGRSTLSTVAATARSSGDGIEADEGLGHSHRHREGAVHSRPPREGSVGINQIAKLALDGGKAVVETVLIEVSRKRTLARCIVVGGFQPWCRLQTESLEVVVEFQTALERRSTVGCRHSPLTEHIFYMGVGADNHPRDAVGEVSRRERHRILVVGVGNIRKGLNHEPRGVVGVFKFYPYVVGTLRQQTAEGDIRRRRSHLSEWIGVDNRLTIGHNGEILLLTIGKSGALGRHPDDEHAAVGH